jgi:hypothetical protein
MSAQTDRLLVWRSIRCDPPPQSLRRDRCPGTRRTPNTRGLKTSPGGSTRAGSRSSPRVFGPPRNTSFSRFKDGTVLMRLPCSSDACRYREKFPWPLPASGRCCYSTARRVSSLGYYSYCQVAAIQQPGNTHDISLMRGACTPAAATPLRLTSAGGCQAIIFQHFIPLTSMHGPAALPESQTPE